MPRPRLDWGQWNAVCDVCGFRFKSSEMRKRWDNLMVCEQDYELRNPQDFLRVRGDNPSVPWTRPETDLIINICYLWNRLAYADMGTADCMVADNTSSTYQQGLAVWYGQPMLFGVPYGPPLIFPKYVCTSIGSMCFPSYAVAGCMLPSNVSGFNTNTSDPNQVLPT